MKLDNTELKPHIDRLCFILDTSIEELISNKKLSAKRDMIFRHLYYNLDVTLKTIAKEFKLTPPAIQYGIKKANRKMDEGQKYFNIEKQLTNR
jgi:predicted DNA-binding protein YlxM (UPF0122 family)